MSERGRSDMLTRCPPPRLNPERDPSSQVDRCGRAATRSFRPACAPVHDRERGTVSRYNIVVFVHVMSAVVLIGGGLLATPVVHGGIRRAGTVSELRRWLSVGRPLDWIDPLSSIALLATGIYLASRGEWWGESWVRLAVALWVVNATLAGVAVKPSMSRLARLADIAESEQITPQMDTLKDSRNLTVITDLLLANDLGVLFLMVTKPSGYLVPVLVLVIAQLALLGSREAVRPRLARRASHAGSAAGWVRNGQS